MVLSVQQDFCLLRSLPLSPNEQMGAVGVEQWSHDQSCDHENSYMYLQWVYQAMEHFPVLSTQVKLAWRAERNLLAHTTIITRDTGY